jgi:hypothetical protein
MSFRALIVMSFQATNKSARELGITRDQVRYKASAGLIPVHRPKGRNLVYAFKSEITAHMRAIASKCRTPS